MAPPPDRPDPIARYARAQPEAPALQGPSRVWTYREMDTAVARRCARLLTEGVEQEARVALRMGAVPEMVLLLWALWRAGAVAVPLSTRLPPGAVVEQAEAVGAARLITADGAVAAASETLPVQAPQTVREWGGPAPSTSAQPIDRPATIVYTSGSTGPPKAALHTWANHLYSAKGANANMPLRRGDRWLLSLPLYHVGGLAVLVRCALAGATVEVPPPDTSVEAALDNGATHVSMVATQYRRVLTAIDGPPPPAVRAVLLGGGPIPDALLRAGRAQNWPLHTTYGCTEMASQVTTTPPGASLDTLRSAGRRLPHRRLRVDDGQILVGGPPLFAGYVTPDGIDNPRIDGGWYPTGDRGHLDAQGRLHVAGRMDRMFVSGGENIQPEEIESVLERVDGVQRAVVVPVPDPEYGRRPVAFVRHSAEVSAEDLRATLRDTLPGFKIPEAFHSLTDADTENGLKVDHARLKKRARKLHE